MGVIRLAGYLSKHGHAAEYLDPNLNPITGVGPRLEEKLLEKSWDIIGFSCLEETLAQDIGNMHLTKGLCPDALMIAGGIEAQFNYQTILDKSPCSIVVIGEGEEPMLMIADGKPLHEVPGIVMKSPSLMMSQEVFNEATLAIKWEDLPYEAYWDHYVNLYGERMTELNEQEIHTVRVFSRNRCPIGCKFCSSTNQLTWGSGEKVPVISITGDNLISVVDRVVASHPRTKTIYLTDDDFCINKAEVMRFCAQVVERDYGELTFMCFARASDLNEELLTWMKKANFRRLIIGVESFSQTVLDEMNKRCSEEQVHNALELCHKIGIKPHINVILVTPKTTLWDIERTVEQALGYLEKEYVYVGVIGAIRPLKGTDYFEEHVDFLSRTENIPGTNMNLRIDEIIWAEDPVVREVQELYHQGIEEEVERRVEEAGIAHRTSDNVARFSLEFMAGLIEAAKKKYGAPKPNLREVGGSQ